MSRNAGQRLVAVLRRELPAVVDLLASTAVEELRIEQDETVFAIKRSLGAAETSDADTAAAEIPEAATERQPPPSDDAAPPPADTWTMIAPCVGISA